MGSYSNLQSLILALEPEEERSIKIQIRRPIQKWLFKVYSSGLSHEEVKRRYLEDNGSLATYYVECSTLTRKILELLSIAGESPKGQLATNISHIRVLVRKSLFRQATSFIKQTLKLAIEIEDFSAIISLVREQKEVWLRVGKYNPKQLSEINLLEKEARQHQATLIELEDILLTVSQTKNVQNLKDAMLNPLLSQNLESRSIRIAIHRIRILCLGRIKSQNETYEDREAIVELLDNSKFLAESDHQGIFIRNLHALGLLCIEKGESKKSLALISRLESAIESIPAQRPRLWNLKFTFLIEHGTVDELHAISMAIQKELKLPELPYNVDQVATLFHSLIIYSMCLGKLLDAAHYANQLSLSPTRRKDLVGFGKWFSIFLKGVNHNVWPDPSESGLAKRWIVRNFSKSDYEAGILRTITQRKPFEESPLAQLAEFLSGLEETARLPKENYFPLHAWIIEFQEKGAFPFLRSFRAWLTESRKH